MKEKENLVKSMARLSVAFQDFVNELANSLEGPEVATVPVALEEEETAAAKKKRLAAEKKAATAAKKAAAAAEKKDVAVDTKGMKVFNKDNPPGTPAERELFQGHWAALGTEGQGRYLDGAINSLGEVIGEVAATEELEELDTFDLGGGEASTTGITLDELRSAAAAKAKRDGKQSVIDIFAAYGYKQIADAKPHSFEVLHKSLS